MIGTHSGIAMGFYGTSHHCNEDIGLLRAIADLTVMAPCDANAIRAAITSTLDHDGPIYFRVGRGREAPIYDTVPEWKVGGSHRLRDGNARDGPRDRQSGEALARGARHSGQGGHRPRRRRRVFDPRRSTRQPILAAPQSCTASSSPPRSTTSPPALAAAVAEVLAEAWRSERKLVRIGMPDQYSLLGPPTHLYRHYGLDGEGVAAKVREALKAK